MRRAATLVCCLLILAGSFKVPGYLHAHADGDRPHAHDGRDCRCSDASGHHHHSSLEADRCAGCSFQMASIEPHAHVFVFGFEFTVPATDEDGNHEHDQTCIDECLLRWSVDTFCYENSDIKPDYLRDDIPCDSSIISADPSSAVLVGTGPVSCAPLCDTARHERSGVQLT